MTFFDGNAVNGSGITNVGTLIINNSTFFNDSSAQNGGAIYNVGTLTIKNSNFYDNHAAAGGAIEEANAAGLVSNNWMQFH